MILSWHIPLWSATILVVAVGTCVIVAGASLGARWARPAVWQQAFWRVAILGILTLLVAEVTGLSTGLVQWWQIRGGLAGLPGMSVSCRAGEATITVDRTEFAAELLASEPAGEPVGERATGHAAAASDVFPLAAANATDAFGGLTRGAASVVEQRSREPVSATHPSQNATGVLAARAPRVASHGPAATTFGSRAPAPSWDLWLAILWGLGAALLAAHTAATRWRLWRFRRRQRAWEMPGLRGRVERLAMRLGWQRRVEILASPRVVGPLAFGVLRPVIVLPTDFLRDFDLQQQDAILAHELAHLAARDPAWQLLADVTAALVWWHPLTWWARRQGRIAGELAADEASLLVPEGAGTLAGCLVELARRMASGPQLVGLAMAGPRWRSTLGQRVERLLGLRTELWQPPRRRGIRVAITTIAMVLVLVALCCTAWARTQAPRTEGVTTMKIFAHGWRQSLAAVALTAVLGPTAAVPSQSPAAEPQRDAPRAAAEREGERRDAPRERDERSPEARAERDAERERGPERERDAERERSPERQRDAERERGPESPEARAARMRESAQRRAQLLKEAAEIRHKLQTLQPHQDGEARELKGALERIEVQLRELAAPGPRGEPDRERIQARLEELKDAHHRAREAGRGDEAEHLTREARELMQRLERTPGERPPVHPEGDDLQRRMHHLRVAIENLRAAGLHDQANALARDAERLAHGERPEPPHDMPPPGPQLERAVHELRDQVQDLRHQLEEIRQHLRNQAERG
jgi:beta-lactamase regulating signal transducer with metallopeptidase domain